jgi:acyl-[acyl-carrier-protein]-phospholipid O-acyltransferase/long-chain-fatty-acid--[acyl-carrier-protein] ligase
MLSQENGLLTAALFSSGLVILALFALVVVGGAVPGLIYRPLLWLVTHTIYRVRVFGREHVPAQGAALIVCNHVSYIDWLLLLAAQRRPIRFVIFAAYARMWGVRHLLRWAGVIPIDGSAGPRSVLASLRQARAALARGEVVCIFAEGNITRTGFLLPFHRGFEQIVKRTPVPIIPACLDHVWGSIFSYQGGRFFWKWPREIPYPVSVAFGTPLPPTTPAAEVRLAIQKLSADCSIAAGDRRRPVHRRFVRVASRHPFRPCLTDSSTSRVYRYGEVLAAALILSRRLRQIVGEEKMVALWLPPSCGGVFANVALALLGKTSVNLNYTAGPDAVNSALRQCGVRHVLSAKRFLSKVPLEVADGVERVYLDELATQVTRGQRLRAFLSVLLTPGWLLERRLGLHRHRLDDLATVIFSSGSTGEPKGVMLTHANVAANAESMTQAVDLRPSDRALGILPFFHSFGYTVTLWVPLQVGMSAVYHPDPRQGKEIGELCRKFRCTILLTTATFLRFCLRRCEPDDFNSLRILICGAEKLPQSLAEEFRAKFGVLPLEGYGCTELSPAAAANVPDREGRDGTQIGNKPGTIGQPLPGVAARIVHPETYQELPPGQEGLLLMYGANVMAGYLGKPELTQAVIRNGWYVTGDMARIDEDGFISLTGRLARFAKIGGEMVPLERIEEELNGILGHSERVCAVTAVPDEKKGERLVVLHTALNGKNVRQVCRELNDKGLPNLWLPGERDFYEVAELPLLGSGKLDLKRIKEMALARVRALL